MLIGELAATTGVSAKTLRFYESRGLLDDPGRTPGGYRDYPEAAVDRVRFVKEAQAAGLTLAQIGEVLAIRDGGQAPCAHVAGFVEHRLDEVEARLRELRRIRRELLALRERLERLDPGECGPDTICVALQAG